MKGLRSLFLAFVIILSIVATSLCVEVVSAVPVADWNEVTRFTSSGTTDYFTCGHAEWRIRWSYVPSSSYPQYATFSVITYPQGENALFVDFIMKTGDSETSGVSYIHNNEGTFYCKISTANTQSFTVIIEQDVDSIPEFQSLFALLLFVVATLPAIIVCRRKRH